MLLLLACVPDDPPAETRCDWKDDDGDGRIDEGVEPTWYADRDGDGFGTAATALAACEAPEGYVAADGDCDDTDAAAFPGGTEACGGGDEDCDGAVDPDGAAGCVDTWPDADGDGLGEGDPTCVCDPGDDVQVGGDCDGADVDRGADCAEGAIVARDGARLLGDGGSYWSLLGAGEGADGAEALVLVSNDQRIAVTTIPDADTDVSTAALLLGDAPTWSRPVLGDLDADGIVDLLLPAGDLVADDTGYTHAPVLTAWTGPLAAPVTAWSVAFDDVHGAGATESTFVADLDGDAVPEAWYVLGSGPGAPGQHGAWRVDGGDVTTLAFAEDEVAGRHILVTPLGDVDGDGLDDLGSWSTGALSVHRGPLDGLPADADAAVTLAVPPLDDVVPLGDLDGDGLADVGIRETRIWVLTTVASGDLADVATARIGPETDDAGDSALFVAPGPDGALLVADTFWPFRTGAGNLRGALYRFDTVPVGVVDARAADVRVYGDDYGLFGAFPTVLDDGRIAVGAPLTATDVGTGVVWVLGD